MERTWKAVVVDQFSLSEVFGGASEDPARGWWHFDPYVIPEVIDYWTHEPIRQGMGILVLTALYPFQEAQPLVRYVTGDLVEVTYSQSSQPLQLAMRPLGRARYGVPRPNSTDWLLTPASILEVVDGIPNVLRKPLFRDAAQVRDPESIGIPQYRVSWQEEAGKVIIQLSIATKDVTRGKSASIEESVMEGLRQLNAPLKAATDCGGARLQISTVSQVEPDLISRPD